MDKTLIIKAFFKMLDENNESIANLSIDHEITSSDKEFTTNTFYELLKKVAQNNIPENYKISDLTLEEIKNINEEDACDTLQSALSKDKFFKLFEKYNDDDVLDVKTAKQMINSIFANIKNKENTSPAKNLNCFVIGLMDLKETSNLITKGSDVFLKASHLAALDCKVDMENIEDIINLNLEHLDYDEIHNFCTDFLLAEAQGLINSEIVESFK
ncbi:hypothetical protein ACNSOL_12180 (plasmid) [Aliarcobacter lanthieri]|uniref:hypothetical protein n=1 Tax=Aliarcobacter lanthieri TaxID=1355374 RepID=UPI003AAE43AC